MSNDTKPGSLDSVGKPFHRRMSEERLQSIADSALLKVLQYIVTGIAIPLLLVSLNAVLNRLGDLESAINKYNTINATIELRLQTIERSRADQDAVIRVLTERVAEHGYEIRAIKGSKP